MNLKTFVFLGLINTMAAAGAPAEGIIYPHRWVFVSRSLQAGTDVDDIREIARVAAEHGLNGIVLSAGLDRLDLQPPAYFQRLAEVKKIAEQFSLEIIPQIFSAGYGSAIISHNRNLAEGLPVKNALFVAHEGLAVLEPDPAVRIINGGFEDYNGNQARGYSYHDRPGEVSFIDSTNFHSGAVSLNFRNFEKFQYGHARVMQELPVQPYRCYRVTVWVKTQELKGDISIQILSTTGRAMAPLTFKVPATTDWRKLTAGVNTQSENRIRVYVGVWGGEGGTFWVDDLAIEEVGLTNVVRRPGTPVAVRSDKNEMTYQEGVDFGPIVDPQLTFRFDHDGPQIRLMPGSRISEGERLRVNYYHGISINDGQVTICMSEPEVYEIWSNTARLVHEHLAAQHYLLSMDEIRAGGSDEACQRREMSMAQILGDCITRQVGMIRLVNPVAEIAIWSDMLDPNHNAKNNYYLVDGDYTGSWEHVPQDLVIMCWYYAKRWDSLKHFSGLGFRTFAGAYYDGDTLDNPRDWLQVLDQTGGAIGIMYTTWQNKYALLPAFGDLVSQRGKFKGRRRPSFSPATNSSK